MSRALWRILGGFVVIKVKGPRLERFLSRLADAGIALWDAERLASGMLVARVRAADFRRIRVLCRRQGWSVAIVEKHGLPFLVARVLKRKLLALGAVGCLVALYVASGYIWFIDVSGEAGVSADRILAIAAEAGLRRGVRADALDRQRIQLELLLNVQELSWAAVHVQGTRALIEVAGRSALDPALTRPGDVIAARDGIIEKLTVLQGSPLVAEGETVRRGDLLISGFIPPDDPRHRQLLAAGKAPYVRADGIVTARVWYEGVARVRLVTEHLEPTGRRSWRLELFAGGHRLRVGQGEGDFERFEVRRTERVFSVGSTPLGFAFARFEEVRARSEVVPEAAARELARQAALLDLEAKLPSPGAALGEPEVEVELVAGDGGPVVVARAKVEVIEDIRAYRPYP